MFIFADEHKTIIIMNKVQINAAVADKLKKANTLEELKGIAAMEGYELSDEQLEGVAGGGDINCLEKDLYPSLDDIDCPPFALEHEGRPL